MEEAADGLCRRDVLPCERESRRVGTVVNKLLQSISGRICCREKFVIARNNKYGCMGGICVCSYFLELLPLRDVEEELEEEEEPRPP